VHGGSVFSLYHDPDFAREIAAAKFAGVRAKFPDPRKK
jgi:hypothetical protein